MPEWPRVWSGLGRLMPAGSCKLDLTTLSCFLRLLLQRVLVGPTYHNFHPHAFSSSFSMLLSSSSRSCPH